MTQKARILALCAALALLLAAAGWWFAPRRVLPEGAEAASVRVLSGSTGVRAELDAASEDGAAVLELLEASSLRSRSFSPAARDGFGYVLEVFDADGNRLCGFMLNGDDMLLSGAFRYRLSGSGAAGALSGLLAGLTAVPAEPQRSK